MKNSVLLVSIDALNPEFVFRQEKYGIHLSTINRLLESAAAAREGIQSVFPTFTYPCHQSIITGTDPATHGIVNNILFDPSGLHKGAWNWFVSRKVGNLWQAAKNGGYVTASTAFPTSVNAEGDYIVPEFWWDGSPLDSEFINAVSRPNGLVLEMEKEIGRCAGGLDLSDLGDIQRGRSACWLLKNKLDTQKNEKPFFLTAYFASFDQSAHDFGVNSEQAAASLMKIDHMLGEMIETAQKASGGDLIVCVVSDHGTLDNTHNIHPNVLFREAGLIRASSEGHILSDLMQDPENGVLEILTGEQARARGGFPDSDFVIVSKKGYEIRDDILGEYCTEKCTQKAQHGYSETFEEMKASFIISGKQIPKRNIIGMKLIDIAPTLAALMDIGLPDAEGRDVLAFDRYMETIPAVKDAAMLREVFWLNPSMVPYPEADSPVSGKDIDDAEKRLIRFAPYLAKVFPETGDGIIESPVRRITRMQKWLKEKEGVDLQGNLWVKLDSHLPISGSVKARGGIYEVLKHAEMLALREGLLHENDDYRILANARFRNFFSDYSIQVGSTGNLGMSIGIMSAQLGFKVTVHMSSDAKQWKKDLLRARGVTVIEYPTDYGKAVENGRKQSDLDPKSYFVDDERSLDLFLGYSVAGRRLKKQLLQNHVKADSEHPLFVYIPCGIGGAPGGITFGLKELWGDNVHCFFCEPTEACRMMLGMATGLHENICVQDIGISGKTEADGLAVTRPSALVGHIVGPMLSGIATIQDAKLYPLMKGLFDTESLFIEPSACAGFACILQNEQLQKYISEKNLTSVMKNANHIVWATGGSLVPEEMVQVYLKKANQ